MTTDEVKELMNKGLITQVINPTDVVNNMETEPGSCDYQLPVASDTTLGGIKVGDGLDIDADGKLHTIGGGGSDYELPIASKTTLGGIKVGDGLSSNSDGTLKVNIGSGLEWSSTNPGFVNVKYGQGLSMDTKGTLYATSGYTLPIASKTTLGGVKIGTALSIDGDGNLAIRVGDGLHTNGVGQLVVKTGNGLGIDYDGKLYVTGGGGGSGYTLPIASNDTLGGVKVGTNIGSQHPYAKIGINVTTGEIGLNYGSGLGIDSNGKLYVTGGGSGSDYQLPTASETTLGGIKVGTGLRMVGDKLGLVYASQSASGLVKVGKGLYMKDGELLEVKIGTGLEIINGYLCTQVATSDKLGVIKVGDGLGIDYDEKLYVTGGGSNYELPIAGTDVLGGVRVGTAGTEHAGGLKLNSEGKLSVQTGDGLGIDSDGKLYVTGGGTEYELPIAGTDVLGGVMVGTESGLTIMNNGSLSVKIGNGLTIDDDGTLAVIGDIPKATQGTLGGVMVGTTINSQQPYVEIGVNSTTGKIGLNYGAGLKQRSSILEINYGAGLGIDSDGKLYVTDTGGSGSELPIASETTLGGIKVGTGLVMDSETGQLSVPEAQASTYGLVKIGDGLHTNGVGQLVVKTGNGLGIDSDGKLYVTGGNGGSQEVDITEAVKTDNLYTLITQGTVKEGVVYKVYRQIDLINQLKLDSNDKIINHISTNGSIGVSEAIFYITFKTIQSVQYVIIDCYNMDIYYKYIIYNLGGTSESVLVSAAMVTL